MKVMKISKTIDLIEQKKTLNLPKVRTGKSRNDKISKAMAHSTGNIQKGTLRTFWRKRSYEILETKAKHFQESRNFGKQRSSHKPTNRCFRQRNFLRNEIRSIQDKMRHLLNTQDRLTGSHKLFIP